MDSEGTVAGSSAPERMLGSYRIERLLGRGGMGSVFLAYDTKLQRYAALKVIDRLGDEQSARSQLLREARAAAALNHPNICTIHEVGEANGSAFIAMEYVEGRCLRDRLDEGALPLREALTTACRRRMPSINPGNTTARIRFAPIYVYHQKYEDAIAVLNRVPREASISQWTFYMPWALISLDRLDEAERFLESELRGNPVDQGGLLYAARAMLQAKRGNGGGAEADVAEAIRVGKSFFHFHHTAYAIGAVYATLGELDKAQEWIENAANDGFPNFAYFETDAHLVRLRATPRFRTFLARLRKEWEHIPGEPE